MLRSLRVKNWKSYCEPVEFTMLATREQRHGQTLARIGRTRVLPVSAVYGANAAGKSVLIEALNTLRRLVVEPRGRGESLPVEPHLLKGADQPTTFALEFTAEEVDDSSTESTYYYELVLDARRVFSEALFRVTARREVLLFERQGTDVELGDSLSSNDLIAALARSVSTNRLLLETIRNSDSQGGAVATVLRWFSEIYVVAKGARFTRMPDLIARDEEFQFAMSQGLSVADTGVTGIGFVDIDRAQVPVVESDLEEIEKQLRAHVHTAIFIHADDGDAFEATWNEKTGVAYKRLVTTHGASECDGSECFRLPLSQESDGTARFLNLLPLFMILNAKGRRGIFLIDEFEDSLHPILTTHLLNRFLEGTGKDQRRQLIFSTHEVQLMRAGLLRRDEIWLVEKRNHQSQLVRLTDFVQDGPRKGTDLESVYLSGRLGGVPRI
ncbi:AAA family ATPase [Schaalia cardiffensis]